MMLKIRMSGTRQVDELLKPPRRSPTDDVESSARRDIREQTR